MAPAQLDVFNVDGPVTLRKYYWPLSGQKPTPYADGLFSRIFCLSNAPEKQFASDDEIVSQVREMMDSAMVLSRLRSGLSTHLGSLSFEGQGAFAT